MTDLFIARAAVAVGLGVYVAIIAFVVLVVASEKDVDAVEVIGAGFVVSLLGGPASTVLTFVILHAIDFMLRG